MKTFLEFLKEETDTKKGNYVSLFVVDMPEISISPKTGKKSKEYHVTAMYSKDSKRNPKTILKNLENKFGTKFSGKITHASCFDSDEDGTSCIVFEIDCPKILEIHKYLKLEGLNHSYDDFKPHLTLFYDVESKEAHNLVKQINDSDLIGKTVKMDGFDSTTIKQNWNDE